MAVPYNPLNQVSKHIINLHCLALTAGAHFEFVPGISTNCLYKVARWRAQSEWKYIKQKSYANGKWSAQSDCTGDIIKILLALKQIVIVLADFYN